MQTMPFATKSSFVVAVTGPPRSSRRSTSIVTAAQSNNGAIQRRSMAALLAALPVVLPASRALALIPDDDDEELVEKARANRKSRLASERQAEKSFARNEGFVDSSTKKELAPVQRAVNSLALTGSQLASGDVAAAAGTLNDTWTSDFRAAAESLSQGSAKSSASKVVAQLGDLQAAAQRGSLADAKKSYVTLVGSLQGWASEAGLASSLKGL